jgi:hypothetical protein
MPEAAQIHDARSIVYLSIDVIASAITPAPTTSARNCCGCPDLEHCFHPAQRAAQQPLVLHWPELAEQLLALRLEPEACAKIEIKSSFALQRCSDISWVAGARLALHMHT